MEKVVRIIAFILLLSTTTVFVLKIFIIVPIEKEQLLGLFLIGAISLLWANWRGSKKDNKK